MGQGAPDRTSNGGIGDHSHRGAADPPERDRSQLGNHDHAIPVLAGFAGWDRHVSRVSRHGPGGCDGPNGSHWIAYPP
jgi:hypothetical protein